jgi:hypothetical protein
LYLIKTDGSGMEEWSQIFGTEDMTAMGYALEQTTDGGFIIGGRKGPGRKIQNNTSSDVYLIKTDASGAELWSQTYGGDYFDAGYSLQQTADGGFILSGFKSDSDSNYADHDIYLVKTDENGTEEWSQTFGDPNTREKGHSVQQTADGGYIIGGTQSYWPPSLGDGDMILIKTTEAGTQEWTQSFGSEAGYDDAGYAVQQTTDGCYVLLGRTSGDEQSSVYLVKTCGETSVTAELPSQAKKVDHIIDLWGRRVEPTMNQILLFIYEDGTVDKRWMSDQ